MTRSRDELREAQQRIGELEAALDRQEADLLDLIMQNEELREDLAAALPKVECWERVSRGLPHLRAAS